MRAATRSRNNLMDRLLNALSIVSIGLMLMVLYSVRRSHIRVEYSVSWLVASVILLILSRSRTLLMWIARGLGLTDPPVAIVMIVFFVFLVVLYRLSLIISRLKDANIALVQRLAILECQMKNPPQ